MASSPARQPSTSPVPERPNRFHGHEQTWRNWTVLERDIARSLESIEAQDLSAHLYNTHALRQRARQLRADLSPSRQVDRRQIWEPGLRWAAWPLPPEEVPRQGHGKFVRAQDGHGPHQSMFVAGRSSTELEEVLMGAATRIARERLEARDKESPITSQVPQRSPNQSERLDSSPKDDGKPEHGGQGIASRSMSPSTSDMSVAEEAFPEGSKKRKRRPEQSSSDGLGDSNSDATSPARSFSSDSEALEGPPGPLLKAVPLANDDYAATLMRPTIRHLMTRLDALLDGLHHVRSAHYGNYRCRSSSRAPGAVDNSPTSRPTLQRRSRSRANSVASFIAPSDSESANESKRSQSRGRARSRSRRLSTSQSRSRPDGSAQKRARLLPLDWSEILGVAALQGWSPEVLDRTRDRCRALFGETMDWKAIDIVNAADTGHRTDGSDSEHGDQDRHDDSMNEHEASDKVSSHEDSSNAESEDEETPHKSHSVDGSEDRSSAETSLSEEEMEDGLHVDGFLQPVRPRVRGRGRGRPAKRARLHARSPSRLSEDQDSTSNP